MGFQMIDGNEWQLMRGGNGLCGHHPDHDAADQTGAAGGRNSVQIGKIATGIFHRGFDNLVHMVQMGAGGNFGNDTAKDAVVFQLRQNDVGQDVFIAINNRGSGFVARCFNPKYFHAMEYSDFTVNEKKKA